MKKVVAIAMSFTILMACNNGGESGAVNDGIKTIDSNGGLADTVYGPGTQRTDTSKMENREDLSKRDTFDNNPHH